MTTVLLAHASVELYGSDLQLVETAAGCVDAGADVVVLLPGEGPLAERMREVGARVETLDVPVLRKAHLTPRGIAALGAGTLRALGPMVRLIRRVGPDAVLVNTLTIPAWLVAARLAGVAPVCHVHEAEADARWVVRVGLAAPLLLARDVVVNSAAARDVVVSAVPALRRRTRVVYNGVPGPGEAPAAGGGARAGAGAEPAPAHVVLVGRLSPRKGSDVALEAVARLRRAGRDARLTLCGSAFTGYEWFEDQLRARAAEDDLAGAVELVGYADPWEWFARGDVVVVPSRVEPFGNVAVQAMLAARPVVVSRTQGLAEIVRDGETGLLVPPDDPVALAKAVAALLDDPARASVLADAGRRDAVERFGVERYRAQMGRLLVGRRPVVRVIPERPVG
ncbi:glycosyltransferase family 4 protein [Promicromonospora iranensis]|uniref:Glycosyltransferase involved in cell wall biosynthesis n=1 Tax=Promicromonospora iranensis TaxID=1105144 RepID=A0ABU2CM82_9MICO|nr:glycosyltransferase family 4 protein [Promicromonospora iranensis]MDR7382461.1 glycosyltransferase involved in cell wall biosynthesis [Promicromonospora iranensis]